MKNILVLWLLNQSFKVNDADGNIHPLHRFFSYINFTFRLIYNLNTSYALSMVLRKDAD